MACSLNSPRLFDNHTESKNIRIGVTLFIFLDTETTGDFSLPWNLPKPEIIISSPDARVDFMISRRVSIVFFASEDDWILFSDIFSIMVVLSSC